MREACMRAGMASAFITMGKRYNDALAMIELALVELREPLPVQELPPAAAAETNHANPTPTAVADGILSTWAPGP